MTSVNGRTRLTAAAGSTEWMGARVGGGGGGGRPGPARGAGRGVGPDVLDVADDADDRAETGVPRVEPLAERVLAREIASRERLVDHDVARPIGVGVREEASPQQRLAE